MIVLAIAGLILAVVFIAVPALQRNQRNSARTSEIARLRATMDTAIANNNGKLPDEAAFGRAINKADYTHHAQGTYKDISVGGALTLGAVNYSDKVPTNDVTWPTPTEETPNTVIAIGKHKCSAIQQAIAPLDVSAISVSAGQINTGARTSVAWLYQLEDDTNLYCIDDVN